jgi:hypothetical protein
MPMTIGFSLFLFFVLQGITILYYMTLLVAIMAFNKSPPRVTFAVEQGCSVLLQIFSAGQQRKKRRTMLLGELESTHKRDGASCRIQLGFYCLRGRLQQRLGEGSRWAVAQRSREVATRRRSWRPFYSRSSSSHSFSPQNY